jgi:Na+:H+ antiporter, NhaC family
LPVLVMLICLISAGILVDLTADILLAVILLAAAVAATVAMRHGGSWAALQQSTGEKVARVLPAILILLAIGMLIGSWMAAGTIPYMVHWGVRLIRPELLLVTAFLATCTMSLFTGTSWGSAGTIGVALMGVAAATGVPLAPAAGAVVSGAYFGDKLSPLSDTTNVSAIAAGTPLYTHIRHMLWTALPSFFTAAAVYVVAGSGAGAGTTAAAAEGALVGDLERFFILNPIVLLPIAVVIWGIARRTPPALAISASSIVALATAVLVQQIPVADAAASAISGFRSSMVISGEVSTAAFRSLVERGGLQSMAGTLVIIIAAFLLAAAMEISGALELIVSRLLAAARSVFRLIAATMATGATLIALTSHAGVTALVTGGLFQRAYADRGLAPENLSRSIEDSVTITEPLMPWTVSGVFMAGTLGVATLDYAPWAVFCYGGPVFSLLLASIHRITGKGIAAKEY